MTDEQHQSNMTDEIPDDSTTDEQIYDDTPTFIDMSSAIEVNLPFDGEPMEDDEPAQNDPSDQHTTTQEIPIVDMSKVTIRSHNDPVYAVAAWYNADTNLLSIASGAGDDRAYLHHVRGEEPVGTLTIPLEYSHTDSISCLSFNTPFIREDVGGKVQRNLLAVGSYDGSVVIYDGDDGSLVKVLEGPSDVEWCCFHPKGGTVLLAGSIADGTIWMYHLPTHQCLQVFVGHERGGVTARAFTPDGKWVVTAGQDGTVRVWAPKTGMSRHVFRLVDSEGMEDGPGPGLTCLAVGGGPDGQLAIAGGEDGNAHVVHISGKKVVAKLTHFDQHSSNDGSRQEEDGEGEARSVEAVGFCPANIPGTACWCATGGVDGVLKIWNLNVGGGTAQLRQTCSREGVKAGITRLRWHTSLPLVLASFTDGCVCIWDARVGKVVETLTGHEDMINEIDLCFVDGSAAAILVTGSDDTTVKVFEFNSSR